MPRLPAAILLGQNVRRLCDEQGMDHETLAGRLGWSDKVLADFNAGSLDLTLDQFDQLCEIFNISPQDLLRVEAPTENLS